MAMSESEAEHLAALLKGLASPLRLRILAALRTGPHTVSELQQLTGAGQAALSNNLRVMRNLELVAGERDGRFVTYRLFDHHIASVFDGAIEHLSHSQLDR
ncbi:MAG: metalloregulator ArsR/SmtB family transcription factor [Microbacteriaceae bacterium]|jgi:DNA-binding transcriptional ArsR family regulator|nr:metalloregulator ArsR/SmtB family transcription factor [Microbacteriaceae bacterium]MCI1206996.1 metalloregulator ArsR/SmtB family transcription factor [Microbacteriaceae bacterium]